MSEYGYEYGNPEVNEAAGLTEQAPPGAEPKWFRDRMDKVSGEISALRAENDRLKTEQARTTVEKQLTAKGYAPGAAKLYAGEPEKLDEWLTANADALAKLPTAPDGGEEGQAAPGGPPATTVPAGGQQEMQQLMEAGATGASPPQGSEKETAARIAAMTDPADYVKFMQSQGNKHDFGQISH